MDVYHMINRLSIEQRGICHYSYVAEILARADGNDIGFYVRTALRSIFPTVTIRNELVVDSIGLYDTVSTSHEGRDYRLK